MKRSGYNERGGRRKREEFSARIRTLLVSEDSTERWEGYFCVTQHGVIAFSEKMNVHDQRGVGNIAALSERKSYHTYGIAEVLREPFPGRDVIFLAVVLTRLPRFVIPVV